MAVHDKNGGYKLLEKAQLRRVRFHNLRHTFASLLLQNGESPVYVKEQRWATCRHEGSRSMRRTLRSDAPVCLLTVRWGTFAARRT